MNLITASIICALFTVASNILFKSIALDRIIWKGNFLSFAHDILILFRIPISWLALALLFMGALMWVYLISTNKLSIVYPLQLALTMVFFLIFDYMLFNESLGVQQIVAIVIIFIGIILLKS